jgi:hypothetical protein
VLILREGHNFDDETPEIALDCSVHYKKNPFSEMKLVTQREMGVSLKMALRYLVWVGLMNLIHFVGAIRPPHPHVDAHRRPENTARLISQSKFEQSGMRYVRTPRRRL